MNTVIMQIEALAMVPTLKVYKEYFDSKYPCTDENDDSLEMNIEDEIKWATYNYLLSTYNQCKEMYDQLYIDSLKKLTDKEAES